MVLSLASRLSGWWRVRLRDRKGVAAVEFAFVLPLLVTLYFGAVETTFAIMADRKVTNLTSTVADLVAQTKTVNNAELNDIFRVSAAIMAPFETAGTTIVVSSVLVDNNGNATVDWSAAGPYGGTPRASGSPFAVPAGLDTPNTSVIVAEVSYQHSSFLGYFINTPITLTDAFYLRPRVSERVIKQ